MINTIATLYGYTKGPKTTYSLKHPIRSIEAKRLMNRMTGDTAQRIAMGVGAAAIAVPLGLWIGRRIAEG